MLSLNTLPICASNVRSSRGTRALDRVHVNDIEMREEKVEQAAVSQSSEEVRQLQKQINQVLDQLTKTQNAVQEGLKKHGAYTQQVGFLYGEVCRNCCEIPNASLQTSAHDTRNKEMRSREVTSY